MLNFFQLYEKKFISKKELEDAKFEYESAVFQYSTLESEILSLNAIIDSREAQIKIINAEIENSGKPKQMADKISKGKISKFLDDNSLLNQMWIMDPKKKVSQILKEN